MFFCKDNEEDEDENDEDENDDETYEERDEIDSATRDGEMKSHQQCEVKHT